MPHIDLKYLTRNLSDDKKQEMASELIEVVKKHLGSRDSGFSVAMTEFEADNWKEAVYDPVIKPALDQLVIKPGYAY